MKYIDAEKLKSIIKVQIKERKEWMKDQAKSNRQDQLWSDLNGEDMSILQIINSLQQEQPSLPDNLDEAELKYVESLDNPPANQEEERIIYQTFKAGAEWMAKQIK